MQDEIAKNAAPLGLDNGVYPYAFKICLATIGVAFLSASTSVAALFYFVEKEGVFMEKKKVRFPIASILFTLYALILIFRTSEVFELLREAREDYIVERLLNGNSNFILDFFMTVL